MLVHVQVLDGTEGLIEYGVVVNCSEDMVDVLVCAIGEVQRYGSKDVQVVRPVPLFEMKADVDFSDMLLANSVRVEENPTMGSAFAAFFTGGMGAPAMAHWGDELMMLSKIDPDNAMHAGSIVTVVNEKDAPRFQMVVTMTAKGKTGVRWQGVKFCKRGRRNQKAWIEVMKPSYMIGNKVDNHKLNDGDFPFVSVDQKTDKIFVFNPLPGQESLPARDLLNAVIGREAVVAMDRAMLRSALFATFFTDETMALTSSKVPTPLAFLCDRFTASAVGSSRDTGTVVLATDAVADIRRSAARFMAESALDAAEDAYCKMGNIHSATVHADRMAMYHQMTTVGKRLLLAESEKSGIGLISGLRAG